jgi:hypothetical protein
MKFKETCNIYKEKRDGGLKFPIARIQENTLNTQKPSNRSITILQTSRPIPDKLSENHSSLNFRTKTYFIPQVCEGKTLSPT